MPEDDLGTAQTGDPALAGLSRAEVEDRRRRGLVNVEPRPPSRTVRQIVRANVFTPVNMMLAALFAVIVVVAPAQDALFGLVIVFNAVIGTVQELRAKRTLDRLRILNAPTATVVRDGQEATIDPQQLVVDDLVVLRAGDQVLVDAEVVQGDGLEVDESMLTGEADPQARDVGEQVLSGSVVVAGAARCRARAVGADAYAARLAGEARRFQVVRSELQDGVTQVVRWASIVMLPAGALLIWGQSRAGLGWREAAQRSVAGIVAMVPEGLVLLTSMAFAVGVIRLGRRRCLVKQLAGVEALARVDVICLDKTGTLTSGDMHLTAVEPLAGHEEEEAGVREALAVIAATDPSPNATMDALGEAVPDPPRWEVVDRRPFSSARKWSAVAFRDRGWFLLGAPEMLLPDDAPALARVGELAAAGRRVLLLARSAAVPEADAATPGPPPGTDPVALVALEEAVRSDAADTMRYFAEQGVEVKVISGDNPVTVAAVAERAGVTVHGTPVDARTLPEPDAGDGPGSLADALEGTTVFGRVTPQQKRAMVGALQARGHVVAMTGDGVNDVLALKDADLGVAMGSGSPASRAVAEVVLLDGAFSSLPEVVAEGRRVIANIERVANLFLTKTVWAILLAVVIGLAGRRYPFLPRHLTLTAAVASSIPGFFLALAPSARRASSGFVGRVLRFVVVSGPIVAASVVVVDVVCRHVHAETDLQVQTADLLALVGTSLAVLAVVMTPFNRWKRLLFAGMVAIAGAAMWWGPSQEFFDLSAPTGVGLATAAAVVAVASGLLYVLHRAGRLAPLGAEEGVERSGRAGAA